jgi:hypothetical protein
MIMIDIFYHYRSLCEGFRTIKRWVDSSYCSYYAPLTSLCSFKTGGPSMSASQGNATIWAYLSPKEAYEFTVSTHILAGTLAVSSGSLFRQFLPSMRPIRRWLKIHSC